MTERDPGSAQSAGVADYLKAAFGARWNLLFFLGGLAAALLSPSPDVLVPAVAALELTYLAALTSIPRFRAAIDARVHAARRDRALGASGGEHSDVSVADLLAGLDAPSRTRFEDLRNRCLSMQQLARGVRGQGTNGPSRGEELSTPALNRMLWVFLRLLHSQHALARFLKATDERAIEKQLKELGERLTQAKGQADERIVRALGDSIATGELRLENQRKAKSNAEFVAVELDRIEGKIQALTEMAISHQDPDYISGQVDSVAESMTHTEQAIRELNQITGLGDVLEAPPAILEGERA
ncbi:MAG: hypothetical protein AAB426_12415 [Myxococcota bacterium]